MAQGRVKVTDLYFGQRHSVDFTFATKTKFMNTLNKLFTNPSTIRSNYFVQTPGTFFALVDPATVGTIIAIGEYLLDLYSKTSQDLRFERMEEALTAIRNQTTQINGKLDQVLDELLKLRILIEGEFRRSVELDVKANIQTIIDNFDEFKERSRFRRTRDRMNSVLNEIQNNNRKLMGYGYAVMYTLFNGMIFEFEMMNLLKVSKKTRQNCLKTFLSYFERAIAAEHGTPGGNLAAVTQEIENIRQTRPPRDGSFTHLAARSYTRINQSRRLGESYYWYSSRTIDIYIAISGNLDAEGQFSVSLDYRNDRDGGNAPERFFLTDLQREYEITRLSVEQDWNASRARYLQLKDDQTLLSTVIDFAQKAVQSIRIKANYLN
jgi:hypothetical protein